MNKPVRIFLADDHAILRDGLRMLLEDHEDLQVVGEAGDGQTVLRGVKDTHPDLVILDLSMPGWSGLALVRAVRKAVPQAKVLVLTMHNEEGLIVEVLRSGASGYIVKETVGQDFLAAIRVVLRGDTYLSPSISTILVERVRRSSDSGSAGSLSVREREVLKLLAEGKDYKAIAAALYISPRTVEAHRARIMQKLQVHSLADLVRYAIQIGLVDIGP